MMVEESITVDVMNESQRLFIYCGVIGALAGIIAFAAATAVLPKSTADMYREFYEIETTVSISPSDYLYGLRSGGTPGIMVDLRSAPEYEKGHMVTSVNIPAGTMDDAQLLAAFSALPKGQAAITYCYSSYCMLSRKVGKSLAERGIYAKHLTAGWLEIARDYSDYVVNGTAPGEYRFHCGMNMCRGVLVAE